MKLDAVKAKRPLVQHLDPSTDEARISRMWTNIRAGRAGRAAARRRWELGLAPLALAAAAGWMLWPGASVESGPQISESAGSESAGSESAGSEPRETAPSPWSVPERFEVLSSRDSSERFELADGSAIELEAGSRLTTIEAGDERFVTLLERGRARFEVVPGGPRRWIVESGLATVEVVGTAFEVDRGDDAVHISVSRGVVLVRGERVPDRVARLVAGESLTVGRVAESEAEAEAEAESRASRRARPSPPAEDVGELVASASAARRGGDVRRAAALLQRASAQNDPRAALAAFTLGRMEMDELRRPGRARRALRRALSLGLPQRMAQQAERRLHELR